ncbi:stage III sporulation protein AF [Gorillibacterium sp. sgz5001074]|uniref:stage III sporulation protein AF n=1 Tax=Gorillibacterium sp. sgz5001074 TaxID=3446695 RepID=UPI003F661EF0
MMGWLSDWLKQVILIILLAAFVDLLLPNQTMQRYVKTVVSLFILMVLLTPVFELFQRGWDADKLLAEAERLQSEAKAGGAGPQKSSLRSLAEIMEDSRKLQAGNGEDAKKLAEARLAEEMKAGLEQATGVKVAELAAQINVDNQGNPAVGYVRAVLLHKQKLEAAAPAAADTVRPIAGVKVEAVKPVTVSIGTAATEAKPAVAEAAEPVPEEVRSDAERYFRQEWRLAPDKIVIRFGP